MGSASRSWSSSPAPPTSGATGALLPALLLPPRPAPGAHRPSSQHGSAAAPGRAAERASPFRRWRAPGGAHHVSQLLWPSPCAACSPPPLQRHLQWAGVRCPGAAQALWPPHRARTGLPPERGGLPGPVGGAAGVRRHALAAHALLPEQADPLDIAAGGCRQHALGGPAPLRPTASPLPCRCAGCTRRGTGTWWCWLRWQPMRGAGWTPPSWPPMWAAWGPGGPRGKAGRKGGGGGAWGCKLELWAFSRGRDS